MKQYSVDISKIINGGYGLAKLPDGRLVMARHVLPHEKVSITILEEKKKYMVGRADVIEKQSRDRITPPCRYFSVCGGCDLQHATYDAQLRIKKEIVEDLLRRQFSSSPDILERLSVLPAVGSPEIFSYRQRIRLQVDTNQRYGFLKARSHDIVPIQHCRIAREPINDVLSQVDAEPSFSHLLKQSSEFELHWNPDNGKVTGLFSFTRKPRPADYKSAENLRQKIPLLERIFVKGEDFPLTEVSPRSCSRAMKVSYDEWARPEPLSLNWEVGGFCQVNLRQNIQLIEKVLELAALQPDETLLDLYCGMGNFSIPLAASARSILGIEGQGSAIRSAKKNSEEAGCANTEFIKSPIHGACEKLISEGKQFDCVLIDPPRQGAPGLASHLYNLCVKRMIYISCDPATLARDLAELCDKGFVLSHVQPVDMFPQTHHIETVVLLEKN